MKFRPCIDIHNGRVKQIIGSTLRDAGDRAAENFVAEYGAAHYAAMFRESGLNIGMGGGSPALLAKADHVTTPLHEDGIWNAWQWLKERA